MPFRVTPPLAVVAAFAALGLASLATGRRAAVGDPGVIKIVSSMPRSGSARGQTDTIVNGIRLAIDAAGAKVETVDPATQQPRTFKITYEDLDDATAAAGQWTIEQEIANANQAKTDPDVMVYIGTYNSGAAKVSMPILNRARMLMISPANTAPALTKPGSGGRHEPACYRPALKTNPTPGVPVDDLRNREVNFTRVIPTDDLQSANAAYWCRDLGAKQVYVLDDNELYGKGIADLFEKKCVEIGVKVLGHESIDNKGQEFSSLMTRIKGMEPGLVYFGGTSQTKAGQLLKDLLKVGMSCPMMAPDGCYEQAMIDSVEAKDWEKAKFYATFGGLPVEALTSDAGKRFVDKYVAKFGGPPKEAYATYGYECAITALEAVRLAGVKDRDAIRRAGIGIQNFDGATGRWSFDANGDSTNQTMSGNVATAAGFKFVKPLVLPK